MGKGFRPFVGETFPLSPSQAVQSLTGSAEDPARKERVPQSHCWMPNTPHGVSRSQSPEQTSRLGTSSRGGWVRVAQADRAPWFPLPFFDSTPLINLHVASSLLLRYNISSQLIFACFFKLNVQYFSCKFDSWLGARAQSLQLLCLSHHISLF